jgi:hypothetical protein
LILKFKYFLSFLSTALWQAAYHFSLHLWQGADWSDFYFLCGRQHNISAYTCGKGADLSDFYFLCGRQHNISAYTKEGEAA